MKLFIPFLLQSQVCSVLGVGLKVMTGLSNWWCIPIADILLLIFIKGYEMTRGEIGKYD
jgi:hypothetical protein